MVLSLLGLDLRKSPIGQIIDFANHFDIMQKSALI